MSTGNKEIIRAWAKLCKILGAPRPKKLDEAYILHEWCPGDCHDSKKKGEQRPLLRRILVESLDGTLKTGDDHVFRTREFDLLWTEVHGEVGKSGVDEFKAWAGKWIEAESSLWEELGENNIARLNVGLIRLNYLQKSVSALSDSIDEWTVEYSTRLEKLSRLVEENPQFYGQREVEALALAHERMSQVESMKGGYEDMIESAEHDLAKITAETLFDSQKIEVALPDYIDTLSTESIDSNIQIFNAFLELGLNDPKGPKDRVSLEIASLFEQIRAEREGLDDSTQKIYTIIGKILELGGEV